MYNIIYTDSTDFGQRQNDFIEIKFVLYHTLFCSVLRYILRLSTFNIYLLPSVCRYFSVFLSSV